MMRFTSRPAILPASLVAWRWVSLKYAGTVMTAVGDRLAEVVLGVPLSFCRIIAEISCGEYCLPPASTLTSSFGPGTTLYGTIVISSETSRTCVP